MKIIQALIVLFAIVGCLALALGGYFIYSMSKGEGGDNLLTKIQSIRAENPAEPETTAPLTVQAADSEYANIIQQYQPTPTPTPVPTVTPGPGTSPAPAHGTLATPSAAAAGVASAAPPQTAQQRPITTPKPDEGKIRNWPSGRKWVALTYDDGPHPTWTPKMIELLRSKNVKATFYLLGQEIKRFPEIARSITQNGFEVGNHTVSHPNFNQSKFTPDVIREELQEANDLIKENANVTTVRTMRPPYGNTPKKLETICEELGLSIIAWDVDTNDWSSGTSADDMVKEIMDNAKDGSIILMHDRHQKTYDTTEQVVDKLREQGYEFVTVSELLGLVPYVPGGPAQMVAGGGQQAAAPQAAAPAAPTPASTGGQAAAAPAGGSAPAAPAGADSEVTPALQPGAQGLPPVSPADSGATELPVPGAAATPALEVDESKITQPPS